MPIGTGCPPWHFFELFTTEKADRFSLLCALLKEMGLIHDDHAVVTLSGNRHVFVAPPVLNKKKAVILLAHYDCVPGSPGANDNAAALFIMVEVARNLRAGQVPDWLVIFTDNEELQKGDPITNQGSFSLALALKKAGFRNNPCFIFDTVGRGETLVVSTTAKYLLKGVADASWSSASLTMRKAVEDLHYKALEAARSIPVSRLALLPTPFSDDAGFFRAGFPAQTITVLPAEEASRFQELTRRNPAVIQTLIAETKSPGEAGVTASYPETWHLINSAKDTKETLTPEHFGMIMRFAQALCTKHPV
jgi:hypothetical protein